MNCFFRSLKRAVVATVVVLLIQIPAQADVQNFQVVADSFIGTGPLEPNNGGANSFLTAGVDLQGNLHRALYRFDISSVPAGSIVTSAFFTVITQSASKGPFTATFGIYSLLSSWAEGTGDCGCGLGSTAAPGEVSWTNRMLGIEAWSNPGGDFNAQPLASTVISTFNTYSWSGTGLVNAVQAWVSNPTNNHGLLLKPVTESGSSVYQLGARENGIAAELIVRYIAPPLPLPQFTSIAYSNNSQTHLTWSSNTGRQYDVMFTENLPGNQTWLTAQSNIPAALSGTNSWITPIPSPTTLVYQVREHP